MNRALRRHLDVVHKEKKFAIMRNWFALRDYEGREWLFEKRNHAPLVVMKNSGYRIWQRIREQEKHDTNKRIRREQELIKFSEGKKL